MHLMPTLAHFAHLLFLTVIYASNQDGDWRFVLAVFLHMWPQTAQLANCAPLKSITASIVFKIMVTESNAPPVSPATTLVQSTTARSVHLLSLTVLHAHQVLQE